MGKTSSAFDSILDLCRDQHRRIVLATLAAEQRSVTLNDLTQSVLKYNHQTAPAKASEDVLTETRCSLHHKHLPKLASAGLVTYDPDQRLVEPTEQFEQVEPTPATILDADLTLETPIDITVRSEIGRAHV